MGKAAVFFYLSNALSFKMHSRRVNRRVFADLDGYLLPVSGLISEVSRGKVLSFILSLFSSFKARMKLKKDLKCVVILTLSYF